MFNGFERIIEERIKQAQKKGDFENLEGSGKPLNLADDQNVPEELRLAYKILKNADCVPPEIELKKEIRRTEDLLKGMKDTSEKYKVMKKLNLLIMKLNTSRSGSIEFDVPQQYMPSVISKIESGKTKTKSKN